MEKLFKDSDCILLKDQMGTLFGGKGLTGGSDEEATNEGVNGCTDVATTTYGDDGAVIAICTKYTCPD